MIRCAVYLRISKDGEGLGLGIERQQEAVTKLAAQKGWTILPEWVIVENGVSAWDDTKTRPGFERLLAAMRDGRVDAVAVYSFDRLARRLRDTIRVLEVIEKKGSLLATVTGEFDLSNAYGRAVAAMLGSIANMEVALMSERLRAKAEQNARAGRVVNGGRRRYGYTSDRSELVESEAVIIRECAERLIGGSSLNGLVQDLNDRGVVTSYGKRWTPKKLRTCLEHPALCGRVEFHGTILAGVVGEWPAIIGPETFDRLQIALSARRRVADNWSTDRKHLLSGLARCGVDGCGGKMIGHKQTNSKFTYTCNIRKHLGRDMTLLDAHVLREVKAWADEVYVPVDEWDDAAQSALREKVAELEGRKAKAVSDLVDGAIEPGVLSEVVAEFDSRIAALHEQQVDAEVSTAIDAVTFDLHRIEEWPVIEQRAAVEMFIDSLVVLPAKRRGRGFDPTRVEIKWRDMSKMRWRAVMER